MCYNKSGFAGSLLGGIVRGLNNISTYTKTILMSIAGGTASVLGGGKFANGAMSSAFIFMFNHNFKVAQEELRRQRMLGNQKVYIAHGVGKNGYYVTDGKNIYFPDNAQTRADAEAFGRAVMIPYSIFGGGLLLRVGAPIYYYSVANPIKTIYWGEVANDIFNESMPPITPHGAGVNLLIKGYEHVKH